LKGYEVTAFVRDANKLSASVKPTNIIVGDVLNKSDVQKAVENQDAVIICLGTRNDLSPTTALSEGTQNIVDVMNLANVKRVSCCISCKLRIKVTKTTTNK
jgi:biliverdin reductase/flavin reductase